MQNISQCVLLFYSFLQSDLVALSTFYNDVSQIALSAIEQVMQVAIFPFALMQILPGAIVYAYLHTCTDLHTS